MSSAILSATSACSICALARVAMMSRSRFSSRCIRMLVLTRKSGGGWLSSLVPTRSNKAKRPCIWRCRCTAALRAWASRSRWSLAACPQLILDFVHILIELIGIFVDRVGYVIDDQLEQRGDAMQLAAAVERLACAFRGAHRPPPRADQQPIGHGEVQIAEMLRGAVDVGDEIGENAVDAIVVDMKLLGAVWRRQHNRRFGGQFLEPRQQGAGARVGEVEMQPQPAVVAGGVDRLVDRQRLGRAVGMNAEGPDHPGHRLGCGRKRRRGGGRVIHRET